MPSSQFERLRVRLDQVATGPRPESVVEMREANEALAFPAEDDIEVSDARVAGVDGEWLAPPGHDARSVVLYLHGGGFVTGSPRTHRKLAGEIARRSNSRAFVPHYPLAPEHPFPAGLDAIERCLRQLIDTHGASRVAVVGDSAGGGLALSVTRRLVTTGSEPPAAAACLSPWADLTRNIDTTTESERGDPIVRARDIERMRDWYLGGHDREDPAVSPASIPLVGYPPLLVQVGTAELLLEDALDVAGSAASGGTDVTLRVWPQMVHVWQIFVGRVPEATAAVEEVGAFLRGHLHPEPTG